MIRRSDSSAKPLVRLGWGALLALLLTPAARVLAGEPEVSEPTAPLAPPDAGVDQAAAPPTEPPPAPATDVDAGDQSAVPSWPFGAQDGTPGKRFESSEPRDPDAGKGTRNAGIVMTVGGAVVAVLGIVMLGEAAARDDGTSDSYASALPNRIAGGVLTAIGGLVLLAGIPVWATGAAEMAKNEAPAAAWAPTVTVGPGAVGASWTF